MCGIFVPGYSVVARSRAGCTSRAFGREPACADKQAAGRKHEWQFDFGICYFLWAVWKNLGRAENVADVGV